MTYFRDNYLAVSFPIATGESEGLRNAQLGAIHAIASHFTLRKEPALITLPTGAGKTAVLLVSALSCAPAGYLL